MHFMGRSFCCLHEEQPGCLSFPADAFARLGEKTTVMSPEVLVAAGVPCCRYRLLPLGLMRKHVVIR
jgi:hypothetical protein